MTKTALGSKRICPKCSAKFYDLEKNPAHCPKCAYAFDPTVSHKPRRGRKKGEVVPISKAKAPKKVNMVDDEDINLGDIEVEVEDVDDVEDVEEMEDDDAIDDLEIDPKEEHIASEDDDADDESIMEDMEDKGEALIDDLDDGEEEEMEDEGR